MDEELESRLKSICRDKQMLVILNDGDDLHYCGCDLSGCGVDQGCERIKIAMLAMTTFYQNSVNKK